MKPSQVSRFLSLALAVLATGPSRASAQEADDATRRARAREEWYNESYGRGDKAGSQRRNGGLWSPQFRRFMMEAAARERQKWGALIPGNGQAAEVGASLDRTEAGTGASWLNLGPTKADYIFNGVTLFVTDTGRVRSVVPHPQDANTLYVAFSGGGVWKTVNGGTTWTPMTEALGSLSTGFLAMDPGNPNTLYLGLGDPFDGTGIGLVKSVDGGLNWSSPLFLGNSVVIPQILVSPSNSSIVLVATDKGLYRSTDAGASFNLVPIATGAPGPPYVWSIAATGGTGLVLSLEVTPDTATGQVWYSHNNGATWSRGMNVRSPVGVERITVASAPSTPRIVYAMATSPAGNLADVFLSTTGGMMWQPLRARGRQFTNPNGQVSGPGSPAFFNTQGWYDHMLIVDPANPDRFFFGGALSVAGSANGGATYRAVSDWLGRFTLPYVHADNHAAAYDSAGNLYFGTDGGIFKSADNGFTFTDVLNRGITSHLIYAVGSSTANRPLVVGGFQDNGTRTRDGSTSTFNQTIGGDGFGCDVHLTNPALVLGSLYNTRIQKSTDAGLHFTQVCGAFCQSGPFLTRLVPWTGSTTGDEVFSSTNTALIKSIDYGSSWTATTPVPANTIRNIGVAQSNVNILGAVTSAGHVYLSNNGGTSWTEPALPTSIPDNGLSLSHIWFDRADPNIVYLASVAPSATAGHLWKSVNFGVNWTRIDGGGFPTGIPVNTVKTDPANPSVVYAGTHLGVYRSDNGGANWVRHGSGMPLVEVTDVYVSPDNSLVRASTYGRGFWELVP